MRKTSQITTQALETANRPAAKPMMEALEGRSLMSASLASATGIHTTPVPGPSRHAAVVEVGFTITAIAGEKFSGVIGEIKNLGSTAAGAAELANLSTLQLRFSWGDSKGYYLGSGGLSVDNSGDLIITESHTYATAGTYKINIEVETKPAQVPPPGATPVPRVIGTIQSTADVLARPWYLPIINPLKPG